MTKNLTNSYRDRQTILNNYYVLQKIEKHFNLDEMLVSSDRIVYKDNLFFSKRQLEYFFDMSVSIINKYIRNNQQEFKANGYVLEKNEKMQKFLAARDPRFIKNIELFSFKALLNMAMLLNENKKAKFIRSRILDIYIDVAAEKEGGQVKYIDRSIQYRFPVVHEIYYSYSETFQNAIDKYLKTNNWLKCYKTYAICSERVYQLVFGNKHEEYRQWLEYYSQAHCIKKAKKKNESKFSSNSLNVSKICINLCSEIRNIIRNIETIIADEIQFLSEQQETKVTQQELNKELDKNVLNLESDPKVKSLIEEARTKMEWRNLTFEQALHKKIEAHNKTVAETDIDDFIEAKNKSLKEKLSNPETLAVFQRLKDR